MYNDLFPPARRLLSSCVHPYTWLTMYLSAASESGRCEACGQFFIREASLTKHRNNCSAAQERSRQLWKNGPSNIKKLNASWTDSRKRHREEVQPYRDYELEHEELELVSSRLVFITIQAKYICLPGCSASHRCFCNNGDPPVKADPPANLEGLGRCFKRSPRSCFE